MKPVDILSDYAGELAGFFHLGELDMRDVRFDRANVHFLAVVLEEYFRLIVETAVAEKILRRILVELHVVLVIKSVFASEIRDTTLGRYTGTAEEYDGSCLVQDTLKFL